MNSKPFALCAFAALGCTPEATIPIVDISSWVEVDATEDPFSDRPDETECPPSSRVVETQGKTAFLEIDMSLCDYITLRQPTLVDVNAGERVRFEWGHRDLNAGEKNSATGHVAFWLGDTVVEDLVVDIPQDAKSHVVTLELADDLEAASDAWLHLHNHGDNQWYFATAEVVPQ